MSTRGLHHVTAVSAEIGQNVAFYSGTLGMRLVKKSVNQDDTSAYHLFYADRVGSPGTDLTFFDWPKMGPTAPGLATVALTSLRIPNGSVEAWRTRLSERGVIVEQDEDPRSRPRLLFSDQEGQRLALVEEGRLPTIAEPFNAVVPDELSIRGLLSVDLESARPESTHRVLTEILGFTEATAGDYPTYAVTGETFGGEVRIAPPSGNRFGSVGAGGVHHVAFRVENDDELYAMLEKVESAGFRTSGFVDRFWFHSVYFREPGGVLFELATDGPGFGVDEQIEHLGEKVVLPPFLEGKRAQIEAGLKPLPSAAYLAD